MRERRRQKRVASLIKEALSSLIIEIIQDSSSGLITITRVEMSKDLRTAHIYLSVYGSGLKEEVLDILNKRKGYLRKSIASQTKLKYNPMLIFSLDPILDYEMRIDNLMNDMKKNEK